MDPMLKRAEAYVGLPYLAREFDCADLAARVQWELFDRVIALPIHRRRPGSSRGQARLIHALRDDLADRIDQAETGCGVLMYQPDGAGEQIWHIGTAFVAGGCVWVLHNSFARGAAVLQRMSDIQRHGTRLEGFYRWRCDVQ